MRMIDSGFAHVIPAGMRASLQSSQNQKLVANSDVEVAKYHKGIEVRTCLINFVL